MKKVYALAIPLLLISCSGANLSGSANKSSGKNPDLAGVAGDPVGANATGTGATTPGDGTSPGGDGKTNACGTLNPNATDTDPSGVGATFSTTADGTKPCAAGSISSTGGNTGGSGGAGGISGVTGTIGDPSTPPVVVGGLPGAGSTLTTAQSNSLKNCLKLWGWHSPFSPDRTRPDKIIFGNVEVGPANRLIDAVLGTQFSGITDEEVTPKPSLILIFASINLAATHFILPEVTYKFHNPNGWYCVDFGLDIASSTKVELKKGAQLADSRFDLSILSSSPATARNQVSILSHTDLTTIP